MQCLNKILIFFILFYSSEKVVAQIPQINLQAYFAFSGNALDSSINQTHGTINNAVLTKDRTGIANNAYHFDGTAYIQFSAANLANNEYSYSLWCKPTKALTNNNLSALLEIGEGGNSTGQTVGLLENYLGLFNGYSAGGYNKITPHFSINSKTQVTIDEWVHIVSVRDSHCIKLYLNGNLVDSQGVSYKIIPHYGNNVKAVIGCRSDFSQHFIGDIDEILIYNRVLTSCEILNLFKFGNKTIGQNKVHINKVCMDKVTSQLTFDLKTNNTYCNSPGIWKIYGRDNSANSFQLINQITSPITNSFNILAPNKKKWELFIATVYDCRCMDSIISNKVFTDDQAPSYVEPDSVSIDLGSQQVIAGWQNPPETDLMGYSLFKVNPVNGNNELIDEKNVLFYSFDNLTFNSKSNGNLFALAGYDSCRNGGIISNLHSPILLSIKPLNNYRCTKKIRFNWTPYVGWLVDAYDCYILDKNNTLIYFNKISKDSTSHEFKIPYLNIELKIFIRAHKSGSSITSTSNSLTLQLTDFPKPSIPTDLYYISVENEPNINLEYSIAPGDSGLLQYRDQNASSWSSAFVISRETTTNNFTHNLSNASVKITDFRLFRYNSCNELADSSNITSNIYLTKNNKRINWNEHRNWKEQSFNIAYIVQKKSGSGWQNIGSTKSTFYDLTGFGLLEVRIKAETTNTIKNGLNWSHSNIIKIDLGYDSTEKDTLLIPGAFTPNGNNPIFSISNPAIKIGESTMSIYNRWGELIFKGDALIGWDGKYKEEFVSSGVYIYLIEGRYRGKMLKKSGTVLILQ